MNQVDVNDAEPTAMLAPDDVPGGRCDATHRLTSPLAPTSAGPQPNLPSTTTQNFVADALQADDLARLQIWARLMLGLNFSSLPLFILLDLDAVQFRALAWTLGVGTFANVVLWWFCSRPERYRPWRAGLACQLLGLAAIGTEYCLGVFGTGAILNIVGLYSYTLSTSRRWSLLLYLNMALGHALLTTLIMVGWVGEHGLITTPDLSIRNKLVLHGALQGIYVLTLVMGRFSRTKSIEGIVKLERSVRQSAEREALLQEVREQLDQAAGVGGAGRFTDQVIGSYRLGTVIGRGAMGEVYEARHVSTGAVVATKLLARGALLVPGAAARFVREATIAARVRSPHIVAVHEISDLDREIPYLAMERLRGHDLARELHQRGRISLREVVELVSEVARGLAEAHAHGIVHRDLKPSNLFHAEADGRRVWKVLDFGVSKVSDSHGTLTGDRIVGTPAYMAPEQAAGLEVDQRADVYALAAIAYRALTGRAPYTEHKLATMIYQVVHVMPPRPNELAAIDPAVEAVLAVGLAKSPDDRFSAAIELADALIDAARGRRSPILAERAVAILARTPWASTSRVA